MEFQQILVTEESQHTQIPKQEQKSSKKRLKLAEKPAIVQIDDDFDEFPGFFYTPNSNKGNNIKSPISVEHYSKKIDLKPNKNKLHFIDLNQDYCFIDDIDDYDENDDLRILNFTPLSTTQIKKNKNKRIFTNSMTEKGQSSKTNKTPEFTCEICVETKFQTESFSIQGCTHAYCNDCTAKYIASKLEENVSTISCPVSGCSGFLELEYCHKILGSDVFDRWGSALCEALIVGSQKFYCPYKDCSLMLINDEEGEVIRESECPNCRRLFCAVCKVPWHSGIDCDKFQTLHKDEREMEDIMLLQLAENKQWRRCPACKIYVEKTQGCNYMKCRCGASFCYRCGTTNINIQQHYCLVCKG
ncbi:E3 ubiquitin-protein ligase RSL1-like [Mercurialis annua]|uniref:E3 ubiquitin-protein ligase RSL1-like n=1 Tax=Mercurialis annua TaxID=3986 RepID=UPI00216063BE|nr:E3 ubiquitin-protein ligase RSL1-like [Mercurialis annua]